MKLKNVFNNALEQGYSLGAFNVSTLDQVKAILNAALEKRTPVILELSPGEAEFFGIEVLAGIRDGVVKDPAAGEISKEIANFTARQEGRPAIFLNLDHADDMDSIKRALEAGFDMVHFDGSELPFEENVAQTTRVVELARKYNALVEGEIDQAGGHSIVKEDEGQKVLTEPEKAAEFISRTGVDILACFFGNLHGVYSKELELDFSHFQEIQASVRSVSKSALSAFFSLHGGSGVKASDLSKAAKSGIVKVNFNTELRQAWANSLRESLAADTEQIVPYKVLPPVIEAVQDVVEGKIKLLVSE